MGRHKVDVNGTLHPTLYSFGGVNYPSCCINSLLFLIFDCLSNAGFACDTINLLMFSDL